MALLLQQAAIKTMEGQDYAEGDILIDHGKIKQIAPKIALTPDMNCEIWNLKGYTVYPGFIDPHSHIGISEDRKGAEYDDCNELTDPNTPYLRAIDAINPMDSSFTNAVMVGITSVMVGPGSSNVVGGQFAFMKTAGSRRIDDLVIKQPAAMKIAFGENPINQYGKQNNISPGTRMAVASILREELLHAKNYWEKKKNAQINHEAFEEDYQLECWIPVLEKKIPMKCHAHMAHDILTAIRIAKEFDVDLTLDHCTEGHLIADEIRESGFPAIVGPDLAFRSKIEVANADFKTPGILHDAGVLVSITTDHPVTLIQILPICAGLAAKHGLGQEEALHALTINAAKICRVNDRVGSLAPGKDADLCIYDGNPMEVFSQCIGTIIDGKVVYRYKDGDPKMS